MNARTDRTALLAAHDPGVLDRQEVEMPRMRTPTRMLRSAHRRAALRASEAYYVLRGWRTVSAAGTRAKVRTESSYTRSEVRYFLLREAGIAGRFLDRLHPDDIFYNVGGNIGIYAVLAANILGGSEVIVFELFPPNQRELEQNPALNDSDAGVIDVALADEIGEAAFTSPAGCEEGCGIASIQRDGNGESFMETTPVDFLVGDEVPSLNAVKIDVEGTELRVPEGMNEALKGV